MFIYLYLVDCVDIHCLDCDIYAGISVYLFVIVACEDIHCLDCDIAHDACDLCEVGYTVNAGDSCTGECTMYIQTIHSERW